MALRGLVVAALLAGSSIASAETLRTLDRPGTAPLFGFVGQDRGDGKVLARQVLPAPDRLDIQVSGDGTAAFAQSRVVYLNKTGVTLSPGDNDARTNKSTIVAAQTSLAGWNVSSTTWTETVVCMRDLFKAYDLTFVESDPGNIPHIEAVFGGTPQQLGLDAGVAGVSPFTTDCSVIENSIVFTFTNAYTFTSREACEIMAQEVAHSFGLDHELLASDPMTYLEYTGNRSFKDQAASCGEDTARPCGINGSVCRANQNSVALLRERLGVADAVAPTVTMSSPPNNSTVPPGFQVRVSATDNNLVTGAILKVDGVQRDMLTGTGPFVFTTSQTLSEGNHTIVVDITDGKNFKSETRSVVVKIGAAPVDETGDPSENDVVGGCAAGGGSGSALFALGLLAAVTLRRRRR